MSCCLYFCGKNNEESREVIVFRTDARKTSCVFIFLHRNTLLLSLLIKILFVFINLIIKKINSTIKKWRNVMKKLITTMKK